MTTATDPRDVRRNAFLELQSIIKGAEGRNLSPEERDRFDRFESEIESANRSISFGELSGADERSDPLELLKLRSDDRSDPHVLKREQRMADLLPANAPGHDLTMSAYVRAVATGDWSGIPPEARAMSVGTGSAGGFAVPDLLAARVIDRARAYARVFEAGATTVVMNTGTERIARVAQDPTAAWKIENAPLTASDVTLESVTLTARTLMSVVKASVELYEDSPSIGTTIEHSMGQAMALELDRAALRGSGTPPEPTGIRNQAGVTIQSQGTNGALLAGYDPISTAISTIQANNGTPNAIIYSPRTAGVLDRLKDTTNQPLRAPQSVQDLQKLVTAQVPVNLTQGSSNVASEIYVADWSQLIVGMRTSLVLEASREAGDASGGAFTSLQIWVRAYLRCDFVLAQPAHFVVITGVL